MPFQIGHELLATYSNGKIPTSEIRGVGGDCCANRTFDPERGLPGSDSRERVLDLHKLSRRAAAKSTGKRSNQTTVTTQNLPRSRWRGRASERCRERSTNLKVVREKEYWLSPIAEALSHLVGSSGLERRRLVARFCC